jgi:hypothetical protein
MPKRHMPVAGWSGDSFRCDRVNAPMPRRTGTRSAFVSGLVMAACLFGVLSAWAAPKPPLSVSVAPASVPIVSVVAVTLTFTAIDQGSSTATVVVPVAPAGTQWSAPQLASASQPGFVAVNRGNCNSAVPVGISGGGPWTITIDFKCAPNKSFTVVYGAGGPKATAPSLAGPYTFTTRVKASGEFLPVAAQPVVTVTPGPAASLELTGVVNATAGTQQLATVTARDAHANVATGFTGTVALTSSDTQATLPAAVIFGTGDAGTRAVNVTLKTAGTQSVTATDATNGFSDSETVTITPGPATRIEVSVIGAANYLAFNHRTGLGLPGPNCGAAAEDDYGNVIWTIAVKWSSTDPHAILPPTGPPVFGGVVCDFGTAGEQTVTVEDASNPALNGNITVTVIGPRAYPDEVTFVDPTHTGQSISTISPLRNDAQTGGLTGSLLLGRFRNTVKTLTQPTYTANGTTYQVGVLAVANEGFAIVWDLDPPADTVASNGATLVRCPAAATGDDVCHIDAPIVATYTAFDGVNESEPAELTLHLDTPATPPITATGNAVINGTATSVTVSPANNLSIMIPVHTELSGTLAPTTTAGTASMNLTYPVSCVNPAIPASCTYSSISGTLAVSGGLNLPSGGTSLNLQLIPPAQTVQLQGGGLAYTTTQYTNYSTSFVSVVIMSTAPSPGQFTPAFMATWYNLGGEVPLP